MKNYFNNCETLDEAKKLYWDLAEQWNAQEYSHITEALVHIPNIIIEICGSFIWLSGDTKPNKEEIIPI